MDSENQTITDRRKRLSWKTGLVHAATILVSLLAGVTWHDCGLRGGFAMIIGMMNTFYLLLPSRWTEIDKEKEKLKMVSFVIAAVLFCVFSNLMFPKK